MLKRGAAGAAFWPVILFWTAAIWHFRTAVAITSADATSSMDWMDSSYSTEYRAASVVTSLWLGAFAVTSAVIAILGVWVAYQWPNPRVLCYKTSYSDMPSSSSRSCCSLYSLNLGFCVFWLLVFAIMVIARDVIRIVACLCFCLAHSAVVVMFKMKFKRYGRPERPYGSDMVASSTSAVPGAGLHDPRAQAVGVPIYNIPMQTVVVGAPADSNSTAGAAGAGSNTNTSSNIWYDAACVPPQQQGMYGTATQQQPAAPTGTGQPYPEGSFNYPPQPTTGGSRYPYPFVVTAHDPNSNFYRAGAEYPQQQPAATTVVGAPIAAGVATSGSAAAGASGSGSNASVPGIAGSVAAAAGAAATVGAGAAATGTPQMAQSGQQRQQQ